MEAEAGLEGEMDQGEREIELGRGDRALAALEEEGRDGDPAMRVCVRWGSSAALRNDEEGCRVGLG